MSPLCELIARGRRGLAGYPTAPLDHRSIRGVQCSRKWSSAILHDLGIANDSPGTVGVRQKSDSVKSRSQDGHLCSVQFRTMIVRTAASFSELSVSWATQTPCKSH